MALALRQEGKRVTWALRVLILPLEGVLVTLGLQE